VDTEALKRTLLKKFQEVTQDRLSKIQNAAIALEKPESASAADEIARELHTMKGEARMLGLPAIGQIAHVAEDLLKAAREGRTPMAAATDLLLRTCDAIGETVQDLSASATGNGTTEAICQALSQASGVAIPQLKPGARPSEPRRDAKTSPAIPAIQRAAIAASQPTPLKTQAVPPAPAASQAGPASPAPARVDPPPMRTLQDRSIRVNVEVLDSLGQLAGDLLVESARAKLRHEELAGVLERFSRLSERLVRASEHTAVRAELERIEGDLHLLRDDAFRFVRQHSDGVDALHGNLSQLADHVAQARLVPLSTVFDAFPRAVREMARAQGKEVELAIENAEVGVDRSLLADVRDALIHLLRNAVDHGIESPEHRQTLGKFGAGRLTIRARADGDMLQLSIEDDGRGIDPSRLREVGVIKRLVTAAQANTMSDREAIDLIFLPGFSTRTETTELSGRGVGMDVVKRKVEALGGSVSVTSRLGRGTTFALRLPQTLALMDVLLVRLGDDVYGLPAADVEAVIRIKPQDRLEVAGTLAVRHRARPVSLVALGPLLGVHGGPRHDRPPAVIVRHGDDLAALVVDGLVGEREVAVKPCGGEFLKGAPYVAGSAALEDGRIAVLLQSPDIMAEVRRFARPVTQADAPKRLKVLLVDDSPIARATEAALVKALGHQVEEAQDGEEGLSMARASTYDLILTDVQMPRMDGFTFTRALKSDAQLGKVPVVILSSLASPEDRRRGADAGADAYLIKGELGVEVLAQAIDRLT
jgi:two-component system chemotaxis sensor kinase CheA